MPRRFVVIRVFGKTYPHRYHLKHVLDLAWHPDGKNGYSKHWFSKRLTEEQRDAVKRFCNVHSLKWEVEEMNLDSDYMLKPGDYYN